MNDIDDTMVRGFVFFQLLQIIFYVSAFKLYRLVFVYLEYAALICFSNVNGYFNTNQYANDSFLSFNF